MEAEWLDLMNESVDYYPRTGDNSYSERTYGAPVSVQCYIERAPQQITDNNGRQVNAAATLYCNYTAIQVTGKIVFDGTTYEIVSLSTYTDETGALHHQEVMVG